MKLYLMRHGQAADIETDPEKGLSIEGRAAIQQLANKLAEQGVTYQQAFHSEKARARQTAEIMTTIISPEVTPECITNLKPNDDPEKLLADIKSTYVADGRKPGHQFHPRHDRMPHEEWLKMATWVGHPPLIHSLIHRLNCEPVSLAIRYPFDNNIRGQFLL